MNSNQANLLGAAPIMGGMTPQMLAQQPFMLPHMQNIQKMDPVELETLVMQLITQFGPDILKGDPNGKIEGSALQAAFGMQPNQPNQRRGNRPGSMGYQFHNTQNRGGNRNMPMPVVGQPMPGMHPNPVGMPYPQKGMPMPQPGGVAGQKQYVYAAKNK